MLRMPGAHGLNDRGVANEDGMQPFAEESLGKLGVAATRTDEIGEGAEHAVDARFEERLRPRRQADMFTIELAQRVATGLEL